MTYRKLLAAASAAVVITTVALGLVANVSAADKYEVIYNFAQIGDGNGAAGLISDAAGNLYGTAASGGAYANYANPGNGVVFKLTHEFNGQWTETVLHSFQGKDGISPSPGLIFDRAGNLYGTTTLGGTYGNGVVFKLTHESNGQWAETVLHSFRSADGVTPNGDLVIDGAGNLYGTTQSGGGHGSGLVFKLSPATKIETVLHSFQGTDGVNPSAGVIFDRVGNLYGTTFNGGALKNGTVFKLTPQPDGEWSETVLHSFKSADGNGPSTGLVFDRAGNLYGTTAVGGTYGDGVVFKLSPDPNGEWTETVLHSFRGMDGSFSQARLVFDRAGNLYGTTFLGGTYGYGVVFKLTHESNGSWIESALYVFQGGEGNNPSGTLIIDAAGNVYGTAGGGTGDCGYFGACGVIFRITP